MTDATLEKKLSEAFLKVLTEWLTPDERREVDRLNRTSEYIGCCATHDYCDANMAMFEAFTKTLGREPNLGPDDEGGRDVGVMNRAWLAAKRKGFSS